MRSTKTVATEAETIVLNGVTDEVAVALKTIRPPGIADTHLAYSAKPVLRIMVRILRTNIDRSIPGNMDF